jgi:hypothetical protein
LDGGGATISAAHLNSLKAAPPGSKCAVSVRYSGTSQGRTSATFDL